MLASACSDSACFGFFSSPLAIEKGRRTLLLPFIYALLPSLYLREFIVKFGPMKHTINNHETLSFLIKGHFFWPLGAGFNSWSCIFVFLMILSINFKITNWRWMTFQSEKKCVWIIRQYGLMLITTGPRKIKMLYLTRPCISMVITKYKAVGWCVPRLKQND